MNGAAEVNCSLNSKEEEFVLLFVHLQHFLIFQLALRTSFLVYTQIFCHFYQVSKFKDQIPFLILSSMLTISDPVQEYNTFFLTDWTKEVFTFSKYIRTCGHQCDVTSWFPVWFLPQLFEVQPAASYLAVIIFRDCFICKTLVKLTSDPLSKEVIWLTGERPWELGSFHNKK